MTLTSLTFKIAYEIASCRFELEDFYKDGNCNSFLHFTHRNFFYSYPEFEKQWPDNKLCQYHSVNLKCHLCDFVPSRNYAGYGSIYLLNNGVSDKEILVSKGPGKLIRGKLQMDKVYIPNTPRLSQMICLCKHHTAGYFQFNKLRTVKKQVIQLDLFAQ